MADSIETKRDNSEESEDCRHSETMQIEDSGLRIRI